MGEINRFQTTKKRQQKTNRVQVLGEPDQEMAI